MNITLNTTNLRPTTMAALIADLLDSPVVNAASIKTLLRELEASVGKEEAAELLAEFGIVSGKLAAVTGILA